MPMPQESNREALNYFSLLFASLLFIGETIVVLTTNKPLALSLDDYIVIISLLIFAARPFNRARLAGLLATWTFAAGALWVMLIHRMPPLGEGERLAALAGAFAAAVIGTLWSGWRVYRQS